MKFLKTKFFKNSLFIILILSTSISCFAQEITIRQDFWGYEFKKGDQELNWKQLLKETKSHTESYNLIKRGQSQNTLSTIFSFAGGALVGIPIGQTIGSGDPNWVLAIVGGALITVAIPLSTSSKRNLNNGISNYNSKNNITFSDDFQPEISLIGNASGLGLRMRF
ncbi:MAG: hypothetical protein R6V36_07595 [Psychroflexus sp.]